MNGKLQLRDDISLCIFNEVNYFKVVEHNCRGRNHSVMSGIKNNSVPILKPLKQLRFGLKGLGLS